MSKLRLLPVVALAAALLLPASAALAQDDPAEASTAPAESAPAVDPRLTELAALVPPVLAGVPLDENLRLATGEDLATVMSPEEAAVLEGLLAAHDATIADYAAAATWLPITDTEVVVIQAHRVTGVAAADTIDAWVEILSMSTTEPQVSEGSVAGRAVTLMSDAANEAAPRLHMFPVEDVVWMMWADDELLVEEAMDEVGADGGDADETEADG